MFTQPVVAKLSRQGFFFSSDQNHSTHQPSMDSLKEMAREALGDTVGDLK